MKKKKKSTNNQLPSGVSEEEFLKVLDNISKRLGHKFKFGYHSFDDMYQQAAIFALEGLEKYDNKRPLENFLWTHVRNRLFNYKRDNYKRPDKPCLTCPFFDKNFKSSNNQCTEFANHLDCELYKKWHDRNDSKKNIMQPTTIEDQSLLRNKDNEDFQHIMGNKELIEKLDHNLQGEHREIFLRLKHGAKVNKTDIKKLQKHIQQIIADNE
jgi:DNA-directed RNA polymerase specialized sigma24 family protein